MPRVPPLPKAENVPCEHAHGELRERGVVGHVEAVPREEVVGMLRRVGMFSAGVAWGWLGMFSSGVVDFRRKVTKMTTFA